jgi:hypothetical protein
LIHWHNHLATCKRLTTKKAGASFAELMRESEFTQEKWGSVTKAYLMNIASKLANYLIKFDELITEAK